MRAASPLPVQRWSTQEVPSSQRFDYYASALESALVPMQIKHRPPADFAADMAVTDLGSLAVVRQKGTAHRCFTDARDLSRSQERSFHLLVNVQSAWSIEHIGRTMLAPGDAMFVDSQSLWAIETPSNYEFVNVKLSEGWMRQWMPSPAALVGRRISGDGGWGRALAAFVAPLSPEFLQRSPLPISLVADQIGSLLALTAHELSTTAAVERSSERALFERIQDHMQQQCASPSLTASDVASSVGISLRTLHRCFLKAGDTFGNTLTEMRYHHALRMLESPLMKRIGLGEIARRAGFCDASHFSRVVRSHSGYTPSQLRRSQGLPLDGGDSSEDAPC